MFRIAIIFIVLTVLLTACVPYPLVQPGHPDYRPAIVDVPMPKPVQNGAIFQEETATFLYQDRKANRMGDIITILLQERTQASKNADTEISKDTNVTMPNPTLFGRPLSLGMSGATLEAGVSQQRAFNAETDSEQNNRLEGTITVTVNKILANGNLVVQGEKWITLNQGDEFIRLTGIVRPEDVNSDNTVTSGKIANARITYSGTGALAESNTPGWLARFFNSALWPF